jgi:hypothetical protein
MQESSQIAYPGCIYEYDFPFARLLAPVGDSAKKNKKNKKKNDFSRLVSAGGSIVRVGGEAPQN